LISKGRCLGIEDAHSLPLETHRRKKRRGSFGELFSELAYIPEQNSPMFASGSVRSKGWMQEKNASPGGDLLFRQSLSRY
jgi:hypothetical protein